MACICFYQHPDLQSPSEPNSFRLQIIEHAQRQDLAGRFNVNSVV